METHIKTHVNARLAKIHVMTIRKPQCSTQEKSLPVRYKTSVKNLQGPIIKKLKIL